MRVEVVPGTRGGYVWRVWAKGQMAALGIAPSHAAAHAAAQAGYQRTLDRQEAKRQAIGWSLTPEATAARREFTERMMERNRELAELEARLRAAGIEIDE